MKDVIRLRWRQRVSESGPWEEDQHDFDTYGGLDAW